MGLFQRVEPNPSVLLQQNQRVLVHLHPFQLQPLHRQHSQRCQVLRVQQRVLLAALLLATALWEQRHPIEQTRIMEHCLRALVFLPVLQPRRSLQYQRGQYQRIRHRL
jgi:hypothetical protein